MGDLLSYSSSTCEEHLKHIRNVLERLGQHQFYASPKKCSLLIDKTEFLGLIVGRAGIRVHLGKDEVIQN